MNNQNPNQYPNQNPNQFQNQNPYQNPNQYPPPTEMLPVPPIPAQKQEDGEVIGAIPDTAFTDTPVFIVCPNCNFRGNTRVDRVRGCASFWGLFLFCCTLFNDTCHDYQHSCPQCKAVMGTYQFV